MLSMFRPLRIATANETGISIDNYNREKLRGTEAFFGMTERTEKALARNRARR
jgi:hypothetical protein